MNRTSHKKLSFEELQKRSHTVESLRKEARLPIYVILENIRSLQNIGSIFRTADGLRIEELILTGYTGKPPRQEIDKTALGAVESVPWRDFKKTKHAINYLRDKNIKVYALEQTGKSIAFQKFVFSFPCAVILGNEFEGIEQETLNVCDGSIHIPMLGIKQSLNVSTAFGVIGYEMYKQIEENGAE